MPLDRSSHLVPRGKTEDMNKVAVPGFSECRFRFLARSKAELGSFKSSHVSESAPCVYSLSQCLGNGTRHPAEVKPFMGILLASKRYSAEAVCFLSDVVEPVADLFLLPLALVLAGSCELFCYLHHSTAVVVIYPHASAYPDQEF